MAGGWLNNNSHRPGLNSWDRRALLLPLWIMVFVSMETLVVDVDAACKFTALYLPSISALELNCRCPKAGSDFTIVLKNRPINIYRNGELLDESLPNVEVIADEQGEKDTSKRRVRLVLRILNYTAEPDNSSYTCTINGYANDWTKKKTLSLSEIKGLPKTTTTPPPPTPSTTATTLLPSPTPPREDDTRIAATAGNPWGTFSGTGLYVTVAISCLLLVVIVLAIIYYAKVRARRKRKKVALAEDLDLEDARPHTADFRLVTKQTEAGRGGRRHADRADNYLFDGDGDGDHFLSDPPQAGQNKARDAHTSCRPHQTHAEVHDQQQQKGGNWGTSPAERVPLLPSRGRGQRRRSWATSEDDEAPSKRRERILNDSPRRSRPRDAIPRRPPAGYSRSYEMLDLEESPKRRRFRPHRYSSPPSLSDDDTSEEEEEEEEGLSHSTRHRGKHVTYERPPRSLSEHALHRYPARWYPSPADLEDPYPQDLSPYWPLPSPRRHLGPEYDYGFRTPPRVLPADPGVFYEDRERRHARRAARRRTGQGAGAAPSAAGGEEAGGYDGLGPGGAAAYQDPEAGEVMGQVFQEAGYLGEGQVADAHVGEPPVTGRFLQQPRVPHCYPPTTNTAPSSRQYRRAPSPSRPRPYNTTSMPRQRAAERAYPGRPLRPNRSHPHLFYLSDSGAERDPYLRPAHPGGDGHPAVVQFTTYRPHTPRRPTAQSRRRSRSVGNVTADGACDPRHVPGRGPRGGGWFAEMPPPQGMPEAGHPPYPEGINEAQRQINSLSRESVSPSRGGHLPTLNVPLRRGQQGPQGGAGTAGQQRGDDTRRKTTLTGVPAHDTPTAETLHRQPGPGRGPSRGRSAVPTSSSPNTTPPSERRGSSPSSSSTDNDSPRPSASRGRRRPAKPAEINLRDIKPDNETHLKRPVSFKEANKARTPVACAADVAESRGGAAHPPPQRGLQQKKKESVRSRGAPHVSQRGGDSRRGGREEGARTAPQRWAEDFGVEILPSLEQTANGRFSHFTDNNHSTTAKTPHPCLE